MKTEQIVQYWDQFIDQRALPYYRSDHRLMMRQILQRFPFGKLKYLSNTDLIETVNLTNHGAKGGRERAFRYFISHLDVFLDRYGCSRGDD